MGEALRVGVSLRIHREELHWSRNGTGFGNEEGREMAIGVLHYYTAFDIHNYSLSSFILFLLYTCQ